MPLDPDKITLCWPNYIDKASLSGGGWAAEFPLTHLQDGRLAVVARSSSLDPADTQLIATLHRRRPVRCIAVSAHNLSVRAKYRARAYRDAARSDMVWDSGETYVWPAIYGLEDVAWGDENFWNRRPTEEDRETYTPLLTIFLDPDTTVEAVHLEFFDESNLDSLISIGRVMIADAWQPVLNASYGIQHGYESGTEVTVASDDSQTEYFDAKTPKRTVSLDLKHLDVSEAFLRIHRLQRVQDIHGDVLYLFGLHATPENFARAMLARQQSLNPLTHPYYATHEATLDLLEKL